MTDEPLTPTPAQALLAYHASVQQVHEALTARDEAWAAYQRARDEQERQLPQR